MPRGVYDRGAKAKKSKVAKVAKVKVVRQHDPEKRHNGGLLEICERSLVRRHELCDMLDRNLELAEDLLGQLDDVKKKGYLDASFLQSAVSLLRRLRKWSEGRPIDQDEKDLIAVINGTVTLLAEIDKEFQPDRSGPVDSR